MKRLTAMIIVAGWVVAMPLQGAERQTQFTHDIEPKLLAADSELDGGVKFDLAVKHEVLGNAAKAWRRYLKIAATSQGEPTLQNGFSTQPFVIDGGLELSQLLFKPARAANDDPDSDEMAEAGFDWGQIDVGLWARYEKEQAGDSNFAFAAQLGYVYSLKQGMRWLIPSFIAAYNRVNVDRSDVRELFGATDDFDRYRLDASWKIPLFGSNLSAHADVRFSWDRSQPQAIVAAGLDESQYLAGGLRYAFNEPVFGFLHACRVMVSDGRIPPANVDQTTLHIGFIVFQ